MTTTSFKSKMPTGKLIEPETGVPTTQGSAYLQGIEKGAASSSINVDPITPGDTTVTITNRTISDSANSAPGSDSSIIGYAGDVASLYNSFTTIKNALNSYSANHTNEKAAIDALNARVTALENKIDEIITALGG